MIPNTPAWKIIFEALKPQPDLTRLEQLSAESPDEEELLTLCRDHGILLIVNHVFKEGRSRLLPSAIKEQWRVAVASHTLHSLTMHRELQRLLERFADAEIPVQPFKGPVLSEQLYGDPALRMFVDLDVLVSPERVASSVDLLVEDGYLPNFNLASLTSWTQSGSDVNHCILQHSSGRWLVEVHWRLFDSWRRVSAPPIATSTAEWDVLETLLYLCIHGAAHWWIKLKWVVDVDRCVQSAQSLDWDALFAQARQRGCVRVVSLGLLLARQSCGLELPDRILAEIEADPKVAFLARRVAQLWHQPATAQPSLFWKIHYLLACRERFSDKIGMLFNYPVARSIPCFKH